MEAMREMRTELTVITAALVAAFVGLCMPDASAQANGEQDITVLRNRIVYLEERLARCCADQVKQIAVAMHCYARAHEGRFPDRPSQLRPYLEATGPRLFICPGSDTKLTAGEDGWGEIDAKSSYAFVPGRTSKNLRDIVLYEKGHYHGRMRIVLYGDGHQESVADAHPALAALRGRN
jgi:hypothetical protein